MKIAEMGKGIAIVGLGIWIGSEIYRSGSALNFCAYLLTSEQGKCTLGVMALRIADNVGDIFDRLKFGEGIQLIAECASIIALFPLTILGSKGNGLSGYVVTALACLTVADLILLGGSYAYDMAVEEAVP